MRRWRARPQSSCVKPAEPEYAAINSAIDELIPAHYRGRVDIVINGSFWGGRGRCALLTIPLLDPTKSTPQSADGWRSVLGKAYRSALCIRTEPGLVACETVSRWATRPSWPCGKPGAWRPRYCPS